MISAGNRVIGNTANNNRVGIETVDCPNLLLENMANGNSGIDPRGIGVCDIRHENSPAP